RQPLPDGLFCRRHRYGGFLHPRALGAARTGPPRCGSSLPGDVGGPATVPQRSCAPGRIHQGEKWKNGWDMEPAGRRQHDLGEAALRVEGQVLRLAAMSSARSMTWTFSPASASLMPSLRMVMQNGQLEATTEAPVSRAS